jgi:hypothetical protein
MSTTDLFEQRKRFSLLMTGGSLLFVAALVYIRLQESKPWPIGPKLLIVFLLPGIVYFTFRYARMDMVVALLALGVMEMSVATLWPAYEVSAPLLFLLVPVVLYLVYRHARADIVVKLLALGLLALAASIVLTPHGMPDELLWIKAAAAGLCGVGLLAGVRWAACLWLVLVVAALIDVVSIGRWNLPAGLQHGMSLLLAVVGLLWLIFGVGGSVAIASVAKARNGGQLSSIRVLPQANRWFAVLCVVVALLVAVQWFATIVPDPDGFERLHPLVKPDATRFSVHDQPRCTAIVYCGRYVELTCHPESDGPVSYYDNTNGTLIVSCSFWANSCPNGVDRQGESKNCPVCPPPEWRSCTTSAASAPR